MADASGAGGQDLNIDAAAQAAADGRKGTQPQDGGKGADAGDGHTDAGADRGAGTDEDTSGKGGSDAEDRINPRTGKPWTLDEMSTRFKESASGARELLDKYKVLEGERDANSGKIAKLEKDLADLKAIAEGKNPEGLKAHEIQAKFAETSEKLALLTEKSTLDDFERSTPLATGTVRDSLKALARANPTASLQKLYDENLKAGAEAAEAKRKADIEARKKGAGDKGKGTSTREPASGGNTVSGTKGDTGLSLEEFNALPVLKRKTLIDKYGIA